MRVNLSKTDNQTFDLVVIGAGINGAGIARDAAMRGLRVLLVDKGDLASGTSAWSTRLIHGGLRYLEHGEFSLVRESLREREHLLGIAPHLVRPLPMLIPVYKNGRRGWLTIRAGMIAYDGLSRGKSLPRHEMLSSEETLARAPGLNPDNLRGAALYYDAQVEFAERLVLENVLSALQYGASILTYARVDRFIVEEGKVRGIELTDLLTNSVHSIRAHVTINVSGPWVDEVLSGTKRPAPRMICGTKGSHLIVDSFRGAPPEALYVEAQADGRPFFIIPWNGAYLIGTTDLPYQGNLDRVEADEAEINYLLEETNRVIPEARLTIDAIRYTYAGVRPLPCRTGLEPAGITRRHFINEHTAGLNNLFSIVGGKLTTYRNLSEQAVDLVFKSLGRVAPECRTARELLPGAAAEDFWEFAGEFKAKSDLPEAVINRLLRIYGTRSREVLNLAASSPDLQMPFSSVTCALGAEIVFSFRYELAQTLTDCLWRRTLVGMNEAAGLDAVEAAAGIAQRHLGWAKERVEREVSDYRGYVGRFHPRALRRKGPAEELPGHGKFS